MKEGLQSPQDMMNNGRDVLLVTRKMLCDAVKILSLSSPDNETSRIASMVILIALIAERNAAGEIGRGKIERGLGIENIPVEDRSKQDIGDYAELIGLPRQVGIEITEGRIEETKRVQRKMGVGKKTPEIPIFEARSSRRRTPKRPMPSSICA